MSLAGGNGALLAAATADIVPETTPFPLLVDTATVLTTFDGSQTQAHVGGFTMYGVQPSGATVPRFRIDNIPLFETPLATVGVDAASLKIGGIIGGDNLSRFVVGLDYRGAAPSLTLQNDLRPCSCELSTPPTAVTDGGPPAECQAVMTFTLAGGQDTRLQGQTYVSIGNNLYNYPPTRVLLDACLEPLADPLAVPLTKTDNYQSCASTINNPMPCPAPQYMPSGVDVKLVVATGFPGLGLSANAYDRLRGTGAAAALLMGATVQLHLGDAADEGTSHTGVTAAQTTLGRAASLPDHGRSALALVGHEFFFGPCGELARSRRLRRFNVAGGIEEAACLIDTGTMCSPTKGGTPVKDPYAAACASMTNDARCSDSNDATAAAAVLELTAPLQVYVLPDVTPLLVGLNADLRPSQPTVDGVIGTAALSRLVMMLDYPGRRLVARCASQSNCTAYAEITASGCGSCIKPILLAAKPYDKACSPAP